MVDTDRIVSGITDADVDCAALRAAVSDEKAGAIVTFEGAVRNHDHGVAVTGIEYVGHPSAEEIMARIVADLAGRDGVHAIAAQHRVGYLDIGGVALFVAVSASHRKQAFDCASDLIERVKAELPIWKRQVLADGTHEWSQCP
ncbi:MAG: molybdenum cofactor biosynthesis protein MoaE [Tessaracoccus sp.]|uniref:molybdenum cofactor biosynthesis protein MoaE n=1 Tax=Tessaracoccus sp. TaxID=1971211 RepID=UPI001ED0A03B|nr:molybdenum cofactor biosynthesis protein MoaE [Tessaracoccus sp.]MBK7822759.1 molybdenum cofactor biosynthesis protein MoaE [Tessaracoccus sp.]